MRGTPDIRPDDLEYVVLGTDDRNGQGTSGSSFTVTQPNPRSSESHWFERLREYQRLLSSSDGSAAPLLAYSYLRFSQRDAAVLRRWGPAGHKGRNTTCAIVGADDVLAELAFPLTRWIGWDDLAASRDGGRTLFIELCQDFPQLRRELDREARHPDLPVEMLLGTVLARPWDDLTVLDAPDPAPATAMFWAVRQIMTAVTGFESGGRQWTFSTYEDDDDANRRALPSFVFLHSPPRRAAIAGNRNRVDWRRGPTPTPDAGLHTAAISLADWYRNSSSVVELRAQLDTLVGGISDAEERIRRVVASFAEGPVFSAADWRGPDVGQAAPLEQPPYEPDVSYQVNSADHSPQGDHELIDDRSGVARYPAETQAAVHQGGPFAAIIGYARSRMSQSPPDIRAVWVDVTTGGALMAGLSDRGNPVVDRVIAFHELLDVVFGPPSEHVGTDAVPVAVWEWLARPDVPDVFAEQLYERMSTTGPATSGTVVPARPRGVDGPSHARPPTSWAHRLQLTGYPLVVALLVTFLVAFVSGVLAR